MRRPVGKLPHRAVLALVGLALFAALPALAHGPSVRVSYDGMRPAEIVIGVGQTIHFQNASTTPRSFTLVADDGSFESPSMPRGEGWHHTFETPGRFSYFVREQPDRKGVVTVAPAE